MKYKNYKGHKIFCNCNASWVKDVRGKELTCEVDYDLPEYGEAVHICPDCGFYPWYYLDKNNEPK
jgi:hypothetical protein